MLEILIFWIVSAFFSFGILGLNYVRSRLAAGGSWNIRRDIDYRPRLSIIVPTYNECEVIGYKLRNLAKLEYPRDLMEIVFVDSNSTDSTIEVIGRFVANNPDIHERILVETERKGKSSALNLALETCHGDIVVTSDADCFWPPNILARALPYLADPEVGAISGPKKLLNREASAVTRSEGMYLESMNLMKLGESKSSSTMLFEGGFSAYKKEALESFDPYLTGSDDCGTVIRLLEKGYKTIMVEEAEFFTTFPKTWKGRIALKIRRANQLVGVLEKYVVLLFKNKIRIAKSVVAKNVFMYLVSPVVFLLFAATTAYIMIEFPLATASLLILLIPKVRSYVSEGVLNYVILVYSVFSRLSRKRFVVWSQPEDRALLEEQMLVQKGLV